ncbi:MAG TPA: imidazolonepropionase [Limnochordales bacterium]|nr:imidazolonepropionase [Limnochordales bacterium]
MAAEQLRDGPDGPPAAARGKPTADLLIHSAAELVTAAGASARPKVGAALADIGIIQDGAVAAAGGRIIAVGTTAAVRAAVGVDARTTVIDAAGKTVMPGFVDPHTHLVYAGSREFELGLRLAGRTYLDILAEGGGILHTVAATRRASLAELVASARRRLDVMLAHGTTTVEAKSGYGLDTETELRQLRAVRQLAAEHPVRLVPTFLGAHAVPVQDRDEPERFVARVIDEMIPAVAAEGLAEFCDVFCEQGVFTVEQSRRILEAGKAAGLRPKLHADEIVSFGGAELAAEVGAVSADHLVYASEEGIRRMAETGVVAVLLPATTLFLMGQRYAPARRMIEAGVPVALATDCNPGSSPTESMQLVVALACLCLRMTPAEAIAAATINAAHAIGRAHEVGSLEVGKRADIIVLDAPNHQFIPYKVGINLVERVIIDGRVVLVRSVAG